MFPNDNIANTDKNKSWLKKWGEAINAYHIQSWNTVNFPRAQFMESISYKNGLQSEAKYKRGINKLQNNNQKTVAGTSFNRLKILSRYLTAVNGKLNRLKIGPSVKQIDAFANEYKDRYDAHLKAAMFLKEQGISHDEILQKLQLTPAQLPLNDEERKLMLMVNPRIEEEMEIEVAVGGVLEHNKIDIIRKQVRMDWLTLGTGGYRVETKNGRKVIRRLDPVCSGTSICTTEDFSDIRFAYEIIARTPDEIRMMAQGEMSEAEYNRVKGVAGVGIATPLQYYPTQAGLQNGVNGQQYNYIIDFEIISVCDMDVDVRLNKNGQLQVIIPDNGKNPTVEREDRKVTKSKVERVYTGKYVLGADFIFDCGEKYNQTRQIVPGQKSSYTTPLGEIPYTAEMYALDELLTDPARCYMGFKFYQPGLSYGTSISLAQIMLPFIDGLQLTWNNFYNTLVTYIGRGISIDLDQLADIKIGNQKLNEAQLIDLLIEKNISLYRSSAMSRLHNARAGQGALDFKDDPVDVKMAGLLDAFNAQLNILREVSGLNSLDTGGSVNPDIGLGVSQLAAQGTDNMLEEIQFADIKTFEAVCTHLMYDIQQYGGAGNYKGKPFRIDPSKHSSNIYNLVIKAEPTDQEKAMLMADVAKFAAETQDRTILMDVRTCETFSQMEFVFASKQLRMKIEAAESERANQEATFTSQSETAKASAEAAFKLEQQKVQNTITEQSSKSEEDRVTKIIIEGMTMGKTPEEIAKWVALGRLDTKVIPLPTEGLSIPEEQMA